MMRFWKNTPTAVAIAAAFLGGVIVGREGLRDTPRPAAQPSARIAEGTLPPPLSADRLREVWDVLHEKYAGALNDENLATGALRGLAAGTGDPYTAYADPEESEQLESDLSGSFTGVGIEIGLRRGLVTVIAPLRTSPAERAGIRARDVIVKIDGVEINHDLTLTDVVAKIRGPSGTEVRLTIAREGARDLLEIPTRRERIDIVSASLEMRESVGIITLSAFNEDTERRFRQVARELLAKKASGIILDVRNNPGGILEQAVQIAGHFLPRGSLVVTEVPREGVPRIEHRTEGPGDLARVPTVVLMNGGSASAAEILAAALNEQRASPLVGEQTFGKGSVQELVDLSDRSSLRVTIARWHTPRDHEIGEKGIAPTVEVSDPSPGEEPDEMLAKTLEILRSGQSGAQ